MAMRKLGREAKRQDDELMTVSDMCAALGGVSRRTFYRWRELGLGPQCMKIPNFASTNHWGTW